MESTVFRAGIDAVEARLVSRECRTLIKLDKNPPNIWVDEFMRSERFGLSLFKSKVFVEGNTITIRVPKKRREPIDEAMAEHDFKLALNRIREIDRRFLIFEEIPMPRGKKPTASGEEPVTENNSIMEEIQERLESILSEWKNDKKLYFEL